MKTDCRERSKANGLASVSNAHKAQALPLARAGGKKGARRARANAPSLSAVSRRRYVTIRQVCGVWFVGYAKTRKYQKKCAAQFDIKTHSLAWVLDWVSKQPGLELV